MNSRLEELAKNLYTEGIEKAQIEAERILASAKEMATNIENESKINAEQIIKKAEQYAELHRQRIEKDLESASLQALAYFKQQISAALEKAVIKPAIHSVIGDNEVLLKLITNIISSNQIQSGIISLPQFDSDRLVDWYKENLSQLLSRGFNIDFESRLKNGVEISADSGRWKIVVSDDELTTIFKGFLKTSTRQLLFNGIKS